MPAKKADILGPLLFGKHEKIQGELPPELQKCLNQISKDPWAFMIGKDPITDRPLVWTRHEKNKIVGEDPFPDREYLQLLVHDLRNEPVVWVPKSRQMIVTTTCLILSLWEILFLNSQRIILSKVTEDEACELLENKVRFTYNKLPDWLKSHRPVPEKPKDKVRCLKTASYILAAAENTANRECRGGTATRLIVDEGCYQDKLQEIIEAGQPMTERVVVVSTPNVSYPGGLYMKKVIYDEEIGV